jgi:hypothetical protein
MKDAKSSGDSLDNYGKSGFKAKQPQGETSKNQRSLPEKTSGSSKGKKKDC